jgi:hypothetical protein
MHSGDNSLGLSPSFSLYTTQGGRGFKVQARWSTSSSPSSGNSVTANYAEQPIPFGRWVDFVFKLKHNTSGSGFLQVWMDGNQIVNHQGNLGFNTPGYNDYAKFGYYNWSGSSMSSTARKVLLRAPTVVADPTGSTYTADQVRTLVSPGASTTTAGGTTTGGTTTSGTTSTASSTTTTSTTSSDGGVCSTMACVISQ